MENVKMVKKAMPVKKKGNVKKPVNKSVKKPANQAKAKVLFTKKKSEKAGKGAKPSVKKVTKKITVPPTKKLTKKATQKAANNTHKKASHKPSTQLSKSVTKRPLSKMALKSSDQKQLKAVTAASVAKKVAKNLSAKKGQTGVHKKVVEKSIKKLKKNTANETAKKNEVHKHEAVSKKSKLTHRPQKSELKEVKPLKEVVVQKGKGKAPVKETKVSKKEAKESKKPKHRDEEDDDLLEDDDDDFFAEDDDLDFDDEDQEEDEEENDEEDESDEEDFKKNRYGKDEDLDLDFVEKPRYGSRFSDDDLHDLETEIIEGIAEQAAFFGDEHSLKDIMETIKSLEFFQNDADECVEKSCDHPATTFGYCRLHYIMNWKDIQKKKVILSEGKLQDMIEGLVKRYPKKYIKMILADLSDDKSFYGILKEMNIDSSDSFDDIENDLDDDQDIAFATKDVGGAKGFDEEDI